ncbi:MAG: hypothetical protein Q4D62_14115 [Planctomycetia bacterium]|nr:hypothetical protein [Planctomycetia bacterium]
MSIRLVLGWLGFFCLLSVVVIASLLFLAYQDSRRLSATVTVMMENDLAALEHFLEEADSATPCWKDYLALEDWKACLTKARQPSGFYGCRDLLQVFLIRLEESEGVTNYPPMMAFRDSFAAFMEDQSSPWTPIRVLRNPIRDFVLRRAEKSTKMVAIQEPEQDKPKKTAFRTYSPQPFPQTSPQASLSRQIHTSFAAASSRKGSDSPSLARILEKDVLPTSREVILAANTAETKRGEGMVEWDLPELPKVAKRWEATLQQPQPETLWTGISDDAVARSPFLQTARGWMEVSDKFTLPGEKELTFSLANVTEKMDALVAMLHPDPAREAGWKRALAWESLEKGIQKRPVDLAEMKKSYDRFTIGVVGLELERFAQLREAIGDYLTQATLAQQSDLAKERYEKVSQTLAALLVEAHQKPTAEVQRSVEACLRWMRQMGQASEWVTKTKSLWSAPNFSMTVRQSLFEKYGSQDIVERQNIRETILNANIQGTADFVGTLEIKPIPNDERIQLGVFLSGESNGHSNAYSGPAVIRNRTHSTIWGEKNIFIDGRGLETSAAQAKIQTKSQLLNVADAYGRRMVQNIATRKAYEQRAQSEQIASARHEARLRQRLNSSIDPVLRQWNEKLNYSTKSQLEPRGLLPESSQMWSDEQGIYLLASLAGNDGLLAPGCAPAWEKASDVQISIHETAFQNFVGSFFSGLILDAHARQVMRTTAPKMIREGIEKAEQQNADTDDDPQNDAWGIHFPHYWPAVATFADGKIHVTIHARQLQGKEKDYPALDIHIVYQIENREGRIFLVREGMLDILPPDFNPEKEKRLPTNVVSLRRVMNRRLEKVLPKEVVLEDVLLKREGSQLKRNLILIPETMSSQDGWLQIGCQISELHCPPATNPIRSPLTRP